MRAKHVSMLVLAGLLLASLSVHAHHSFTATYIQDKVVTIEGTLAQFLMRNPHSFFHVDVKEEDGKVIRYAVEGAAGGQFTREGVTKEALRPGDHVVVTGNPGRNPVDHRLRLRTITRPSDGWKWGGTFD
jgi:hypothetical protein